MSIELAPDRGHLRLDRPAFDRIREWFTAPDGPARHGPVAEELRAAGVVDAAGELPEAVGLALSAVADPVCRLAFRLRDGQGRAEGGEAWVHGAAAALLLPLPEGRYELGVAHPTFLPALLVRLVGLGPRPRPPVSVPVPLGPDQVDQLTDPDPARRAAAAVGLPGPGTSPVHRDWRIRSTWRPAPDSPGVRALRVLDTAGGMWLVESHRDRVTLFPTTPTAVWRALIELLPDDRELAPAGE